MNLLDKKIGIIGLGYVGLPLAVEFGKQYTTIGFDINQNRIDELLQGKDSTLEVEPSDLKLAHKLSYSTVLEDIKECTIFIITVLEERESENMHTEAGMGDIVCM